MKVTGIINREGRPYIPYFVVFLRCPLVTKLNTAAENKMFTGPAPVSQCGTNKGRCGDEE